MPRPKKTAAPSGNDNDGPAASLANSAYDAQPAPAVEAEGAQNEQDVSTPPPAKTPRAKRKESPAPAPVVRCLRGGPEHFAWVKHPDYPDGPDLDPQFGDKTPAFVEWLAKKQQQQ